MFKPWIEDKTKLLDFKRFQCRILQALNMIKDRIPKKNLKQKLIEKKELLLNKLKIKSKVDPTSVINENEDDDYYPPETDKKNIKRIKAVLMIWSGSIQKWEYNPLFMEVYIILEFLMIVLLVLMSKAYSWVNIIHIYSI